MNSKHSITSLRTKDPQFSTIKSYHISIPLLLLEYDSGKKSFLRFTCVLRLFVLTYHIQARGTVLGAISAANTTSSAPIELQESLKFSDGSTSPYFRRSPELVSYAEGLTNISVPESLKVSEAASFFDVWTRTRRFHTVRIIFWPADGITRTDPSPDLRRFRRWAVHVEVLRGWWKPLRLCLEGVIDHYGSVTPPYDLMEDLRLRTPSVIARKVIVKPPIAHHSVQ